MSVKSEEQSNLSQSAIQWMKRQNQYLKYKSETLLAYIANPTQTLCELPVYVPNDTWNKVIFIENASEPDFYHIQKIILSEHVSPLNVVFCADENKNYESLFTYVNTFPVGYPNIKLTCQNNVGLVYREFDRDVLTKVLQRQQKIMKEYDVDKSINVCVDMGDKVEMNDLRTLMQNAENIHARVLCACTAKQYVESSVMIPGVRIVMLMKGLKFEDMLEIYLQCVKGVALRDFIHTYNEMAVDSYVVIVSGVLFQWSRNP